MKLARDAREFASWPITTSDALSNFQVQLTPGSAWLDATYASGHVTLLVYGPDCTDTSQGVLVDASCQPRIRCTDTPELVVRQGGWIFLENTTPAAVITQTDFNGGTF